ncbi:type I restriction-modification protein subunit S [Clostridium beijerinckii]|uniref:Restriction endonuclease subunit S n=1 Tax=Clostridium beijerinckii TaxID=1520 RepID=A0AB74V9S3_CLOBE|nr:restriction endonuclease subunit S [Clostridium beijerinckii]NRZ27328.1 type I restriction enzyme S subunit [Clostridium beijerinckii]NYB96880.1 type I restriction enzyme S subunit [Clostridium beijerinckii]OOM22327.1 EcoKI restriction-modification system protein HsdS [Clostridium beijerinckii]QUN33176.1 restriction endonuclease subunit S [Clostridium beijerinckii]SQB11731.1 type I restriction enzyme, specificity subunit [Clostridium beijerinckii]
MSENKKNVPKRRFKEFENDGGWKQRKLEEVFDFSVSNNTLSRAELNYDEGEVKSIHYGDVLIKYGAYTDVVSDEIPYITEGKVADYKVQLLQNGDIIIADTAEDETTGKATEITNLQDIAVVAGLHTIVCRPIVKMAPYYLGYYMNSDSYHKQLLPLMQGIKVLSLSRGNLVKTTIKYPTDKEEQAQIGIFFHRLDNLITLHQRKLEKIKALKKAYLTDMFPAEGERKPKLRFSGFTDDWEQRKLGEVAIVRTGYPFDSNDFDDKGEYLVITNGNIQNDSPIVDSSLGSRVNFNNAALSEYVLNPDDILVTMDGTVGRTAKVVEQKQILAQRVGRLTAKSDPEFVYQFLNTGEFFKKMALISHGGTIKHISLNEISSYISCMPSSSEEQTKIGTFFKSVDNLINLHQHKLEKLQNIKKAYLNEMFI